MEAPSSAFGLLDVRIQRWIFDQQWTELRDAQERAIPLILEGKSDVIIASATASGKTEAAFFPILTKLLAEREPACAIYISPLKALINDQWMRLEQLCERLDIPVVPWHGDIGDTRKAKFMRRPEGCLLITPESLEGLLMRDGHRLAALFGRLRYVVVDELHAFLDSERGKQLQSLLQRIDTAMGRNIPRIALSATLGEMQLAAEFLRPDGGGDTVEIIDSRASPQELKVIIRGHLDLPPRIEAREAAAREKRGELLNREDTQLPAVLAIGEQLFNTLRGSNNLVFPNSRAKVEMWADILRRLCEKRGVPNEFWPHHGSLSKDIREQTEQALKKRDQPATAIATTTLELGIDIGAVKSVAQIGPAPSVASLRQRLGRSGRRKNEAAVLRCYCVEAPIDPRTPLSDRLREGLLHNIAQVRLLVAGWFEPPRTQSMHLSTLVQQLLSLVAQYGGLMAPRAYSLLCASGLFPALSKSDFATLLQALAAKEILMQDETGLILHGVVGERIVNHYSFYAAFISPEEFTVECDGKRLGTLPLDRPLTPNSYLIFAGRRWQVLACNIEDKRITVKPASAGKVPVFDGMLGKVHDRVRQEMREVLREDGPVAFLDAAAMAMLIEARDSYHAIGLDEKFLIVDGRDVHMFTWRGDWVNDTLALLLQRQQLRAVNEGLSVRVLEASPQAVQEVLSELAAAPIPSGEELAADVQNKATEKWDSLLPEPLLSMSYASRELDLFGAQRWIQIASGNGRCTMSAEQRD